MAQTGTKSIRTVVRAYGLTPIRVEPLESAYKSAAAYHVQTESQDVVVKPYLGTRSELLLLAERMQSLVKGGYPHIGEWLTATSGQPYTLCNGNLYYVTQYTDGHWLDLESTGLYGLGQALARLHAFSTTPAAARVKNVQRSAQRVAYQVHRFEALLPKLMAADAAWSPWFKQHGADCLWLGTKALSILHGQSAARRLQAATLNPSWVHGDVTRPNVLVCSDGHVVLIDWERMTLGVCYQELAKALINTTDFRTTAIRRILNGYNSVRTFRRSEKALVCAFSILPREVWSYAKAVKNSPNRIAQPSPALQRTFDIVRATFESRIAATRYLCNWSGIGWDR